MPGQGQGPYVPGSDVGDWGDFPCTVLHFIGPGVPSIDLRDRVFPDATCALTRLGLAHTFGIVTGQDPMGRIQSTGRNSELAARLQREVAAMNVPFALVDACNPDRSHCEQSFAIAISCDEAVALADRYEQLAIFWFDGNSFWIVPARSLKERVRLPTGTSDGTPHCSGAE